MAGLGHSGGPPMDRLHQGFEGRRAGKQTKLKTKNKNQQPSESVKEKKEAGSLKVG